MKPLGRKIEIEQFIQESGFRLVYFASESCSVCKRMREEVTERYALKSNMDLGLVMIEEVPDARGAYQVFAAPTIHVYYQGQRIYEAGRFLRLEDLDALMDRIEKLDAD